VTGSRALDLVLLAVLAVYLFSGIRQGFVFGTLSLAGFAGGVAAGIWLLPRVVTSLEPGRSRAVIVIVGVLIMGGLGQVVGAAIGSRVRSTVRSQPARVADAVLGGVVSLVGVAVVVTVLAGVVRGAPLPLVSRAIGGSTVVRVLDQVVPTGVTTAAGGMARAVASDFPRVFAGIGPEQIVPVAPPSAAEVGQAAALAAPSTVKITGRADSCLRTQEGSGFVIAPERVVTNAHVVAGVEGAQAQVLGTGARLDAEVVLFDPERDLAVLAVPGLTAPPLALGTDLAGGAPAVVVGYPGDGPFTSTVARVRQVLQARGEDIYGEPGVSRQVYSLYAQVRPGNSGGPLLDPAGALVGVVFASSLDDPDTGYALTLAESRPVLDQAAAATEAVDTGACSSG
jgi:S1-C subfamily serine protease